MSFVIRIIYYIIILAASGIQLLVAAAWQYFGEQNIRPEIIVAGGALFFVSNGWVVASSLELYQAGLLEPGSILAPFTILLVFAITIVSTVCYIALLDKLSAISEADTSFFGFWQLIVLAISLTFALGSKVLLILDEDEST